jgi:hypothetical protein
VHALPKMQKKIGRDLMAAPDPLLPQRYFTSTSGICLEPLFRLADGAAPEQVDDRQQDDRAQQ